MSYVFAAPELLASAAADVDGIAAAIGAASVAAAGPTSNLLAAAGDEVSAATAALFNAYAQEYQAVVRQAAAFQQEFTRTLAVAAGAYAQAEAANGALLNGALNGALSNARTAVTAPIQSLLTSAGVGTGGPGALTAVPAAASQIALIMGGTGNPDPDPKYLNRINVKYIQHLFPGAIPKALFTPEQFWPVTPQLGNMTFNQSVAQGVTALNNAINAQIALGNKVVAFGYSQSATIVNNEINALISAGAPHANDISFVMIGNPNTPDGGILSRFPGFYIPFLDVPFNGATPPNSPYATTIYTAQYDGIANAPRYPLNILSDINAFMGYFYVHNTYPTLSASEIANAVPLPTSPGYAGNTQYYMLLTQDLPLVQPIRDIPYAGPPIADLFQPQLRVLVDLGYADYGPNYANVPTPAGLLSIPNPFAVGYYLALGSLQAPYAAAVEIGVEAGFWGPEWFPQAYPWIPSINPGLHFYIGQPEVTLLSLASGGLGSLLHLIPPPVFP